MDRRTRQFTVGDLRRELEALPDECVLVVSPSPFADLLPVLGLGTTGLGADSTELIFETH